MIGVGARSAVQLECQHNYFPRMHCLMCISTLEAGTPVSQYFSVWFALFSVPLKLNLQPFPAQLESIHYIYSSLGCFGSVITYETCLIHECQLFVVRNRTKMNTATKEGRN